MQVRGTGSPAEPSLRAASCGGSSVAIADDSVSPNICSIGTPQA